MKTFLTSFLKLEHWLIMKLFIQRSFFRSFFLSVLTVLGFALLDYIVQLGTADQNGFVSRYPELLSIVKAIAILFLMELAIFWIRIVLAPGNDHQDVIKQALYSSIGAALVNISNVLQWGARIAVLLYLMGPV